MKSVRGFYVPGAPVLHLCRPHGPKLEKIGGSLAGPRQKAREENYLLVARRCIEQTSAALHAQTTCTGWEGVQERFSPSQEYTSS